MIDRAATMPITQERGNKIITLVPFDPEWNDAVA
jgi:hypothetical protein